MEIIVIMEKIKHAKNLANCLNDQIDIVAEWSGTIDCDVCGFKADYVHAAYKGNISMGGFLCHVHKPSEMGVHPYFNDITEGSASIKLNLLL